MADVTGRRLTVTAVEADEQPVKLVLFRNYRLPLSDAENKALGYVHPGSESSGPSGHF